MIRIKNAVLAKNREVSSVLTKQNLAVAEVLKEAGYLDEVIKEDNLLLLKLKFSSKKPVIRNLKLVSKPGRRIYVSLKEIRKKKGPSVYLLNTPKGVLSSSQALKKGVGGELIAEVW